MNLRYIMFPLFIYWTYKTVKDLIHNYKNNNICDYKFMTGLYIIIFIGYPIVSLILLLLEFIIKNW